MLEPIISRIANLMLKAVKYVNIFVKALTGVDLLAKATAKSMKGTTNSAKALNKALSGFDELTNLDTTSNSPSVDTSAFSAFEDIEVDTKWAEKIQAFGEWLREHWKAIALGIVGVAGALLLFKLIPSKKITEAGTSFTGLFNSIGKATETIALLGGLALVVRQVSELIKAFSESGLSLTDVAILLGSVLGELAVAFTIVAAATKLMDWKGIAGATVILAGFALIINQVSKLLEIFSKTGMTVGDVALLMTTIFGSLVVLMGAVALIGPMMTAGLIPFAVVVAGISALLIVMKETIPTILDACSKFISNTAPSIKSILETIGSLIVKIIYALGTTLPPIINSVGNLFDKIFNGISKVISTVGDTIVKILNTAKSLITTVLSSILTFINKLGPAINNFVSSAIKAVTKLINFVVSGIEYLVNTLVIGGVNKIIKSINSISKYVGISIPTVSKMSIPRFVPKLNVGTNYVPEDQLAYIHKGEAVIPKKFNSQEYFGGNNEETNSLLQEVIEAISNIEINPYTTVRDIGQASESYFRNRERRTGREVFA